MTEGREEQVLDGTGVTPLSGVGAAVRYDPDAGLSLPEPPDPETVAAERERTADRAGEEEAEIFDAHRQFLDDPEIAGRVEEAVREGLPAEHAVDRAFAGAIDQFEAAGGLMAERTDDLREVRDRLLRHLLDREAADLSALPAGSVVVAPRLGPADTAQLDPDSVAGFVTATGGRTSHAAIMARSLGIPAVVSVGDAVASIPDGVAVAVDGDAGEVVVRPSEQRRAAARGGRAVPVRHEPVETADGRAVEVAANVGTPAEARGAVEQGADGVGLFRMEFFFLDRESPPSEDEQYEAFVEVLDRFDGGRVVVRTLDVGGDKPIPYLDVAAGANPFLGVRGVRLSPGERADLFETQVRALLRAAATDAGDGLAVMFPLVSTVGDLTAAVDRVEAVADALDDEGVAYRMPELGAMVETPASAFLARELAERVDFLSIGTNDLTQYVMAAARDDDRLADYHDPRHPAVLRAIDRTVRAGHEGGAWVGMCGEMAGDPDLAELLVGLGLDELSMSAVTIPEVKAAVAATDARQAETLAERALAAETLAEVEAVLADGGDEE
ncbi:phosphoenolpyruvate--protein phosphotransferase [Halobacteriales archaeon QS_1_68_17]|nr:MAG: phosphoenolpyruvate--protein phosphotransferase [Halobacteriales archaeon QS_1_68_17]